MMIGSVSPDFRPLIRCILQGNEASFEIEAWVDTGFNGALLVSPEVVDRLRLSPTYAINVKLADGSETEMMTYTATIAWDGELQRIQVLSAEHPALIGLRLLEDHQLNITFIDGGAVTIEPLN